MLQTMMKPTSPKWKNLEIPLQIYIQGKKRKKLDEERFGLKIQDTLKIKQVIGKDL